ncbi:uncharacterized protein LOC142178326 [Nicotiana tabacum]|uniref:Uncharacterized protein LOC142178326 n=1 Tax=Nicotiana tabacum TaxID=4097 RepID=A0AC58U2P9_TOBAC
MRDSSMNESKQPFISRSIPYMVSDDQRLTSILMASSSITNVSNNHSTISSPFSNNISQSYIIKLDRNNYVLWRSQVLPTLRGHDLEGYMDGSCECPPKFIQGSGSDTNTVESLLLSWLLPSLTEGVLAQVVGCTTSQEVWVSLETMFASQSRARLMQLRLQLQTTKKGSSTMVNYLQKMKTLADNLAAAAQPVTNDDLVLHILGMSVLEQGLGQVHVTVKNSNTPKKESNFKRNNNQSQNSFGRYGHGRGRGSSYRSHTSRTQHFTGSNQCQVCSKYGHIALTCYHRFDHAYQSNSKQNMVALIAQPSTIIDPSWYPDSGATNHLTNDVSNMDVRGGYNGTEQIHVENGTCLKIAYIGDSILPSSSRLLCLRNILHVPEITKNLLSVAQFAYDNNVFFEFHPRDYFVKDHTNRKAASSSASSSLPSQPEPTLSLPIPNENISQQHLNGTTQPPYLTPPLPQPTEPNSNISPNSLPSIGLTVSLLPLSLKSTIASSKFTDKSRSKTSHVLHHMITRLKSKSSTPQANSVTKYPLPPSTLPSEPTYFFQANKDVNWRQDIQEEYNPLIQNGTWTLARLVAKGFSQEVGIDYHDTFSTVVKPTTIRVVLTLALSKGWPLRQLDVKNAFLHGEIHEEVYMTQPTGFVDPKFPRHVCRLHKALYGLKQAPRAWFERLSSSLFELGFTTSKSDSSLFIHIHGSNLTILLVYINDLILTGSSKSFIANLILKLSSTFALKNLGPLHYFLGIEVSRVSTNLVLSQTKYIHNLLTRANMDGAKPFSTRMVAGLQLSQRGSPSFSDIFKYRSLTGALQYITITRPDVSYAVNKLCQFMHDPRESHFLALKRLLRYLKGFSDADWAGCPDDRRSTHDYCIFLGHNSVSWYSKKQNAVARSSTEFEYRSLAAATTEITWIQHLLRELTITIPAAPKFWCANLSATYLTANPIFHARTKAYRA